MGTDLLLPGCSLSLSLSLSLFIYLYIYIYRERERGRDVYTYIGDVGGGGLSQGAAVFRASKARLDLLVRTSASDTLNASISRSLVSRRTLECQNRMPESGLLMSLTSSCEDEGFACKHV